MPARKSPAKSDGQELNEASVLAKVDRICELFQKMSFNEIDYEDGEFHLKLIREAPEKQLVGGVPYPTLMTIHAPAMSPLAAVPQPPVPSPAPAPQPPSAEDDPGLKKIVTPLSGTFYVSVSPGAPPFVRAGDEVEVGQVVCIMEAMKIMNEIKSPYAGTVVKVLRKNEEGVPQGSPLFLVRTRP